MNQWLNNCWKHLNTSCLLVYDEGIFLALLFVTVTYEKPRRLLDRTAGTAAGDEDPISCPASSLPETLEKSISSLTRIPPFSKA